MNSINNNVRPEIDKVLLDIADYVSDYTIESDEAFDTARYCLLDAMGCGIVALKDIECRKHIGPQVPGAEFTNGVPIPGTHYRLEPVHAAFNIGTLIRWLDYNDTWLAAEWGHPSDNLGAILACADYSSRHLGKHYTMRDVLDAQIKAYEIQGVLALHNSFNRIGLDHVILVRIASTAVATKLLGGSKQQIANALTNAWIDGGALRTYRHAPNTGWRKSWAAGDACSRAVRHALMAIKDEMGYPSALSAKHWGFYDVLFNSKPFQLPRGYGSYVMENILFKVAFPVEFHAQTAVECALQLHAQVKSRLDQIDRITLKTQEAAMRIINKTGPLNNPADRDHSLQYSVAIALIYGELDSHHYSDEIASDPTIDLLRKKMVVEEEKRYSDNYLNPDKRAITNAITIVFNDDTSIDAEVEYPIGHRRRRCEALPLLREKLINNTATMFKQDKVNSIRKLLQDQQALHRLPVNTFMNLWQHTESKEW